MDTLKIPFPLTSKVFDWKTVLTSLDRSLTSPSTASGDRSEALRGLSPRAAVTASVIELDEGQKFAPS